MLFPIADVVVNPYLLLLLGLIVGILSGFFGVGGGFLITGGLLVLGVPPVFAVGTGLTLIMGSSIINTLKHRSLGNLDLRLGLLMVVGSVPAIFLAEWLLTALESAGIEGSVIRLRLCGGPGGAGHLYWVRLLAVTPRVGAPGRRGLHSGLDPADSVSSNPASFDKDSRVAIGTHLRVVACVQN